MTRVPRVRRRLLRAVHPVAGHAAPGHPVCPAAARPDPVRRGGPDRRGALRPALRAARCPRQTADDFVDGQVTAIVHMEGAEAIAPDLSNLADWHRRGLRSVGLVWSRPNAFAEGVPFAFPGGPDMGGGLSDAGKALVRACNRARDPRRSLASERAWLLGRRGAVGRAAGRHALQRACALRSLAEPHRRAARRDRGVRRRGRRQLRGDVPARGRNPSAGRDRPRRDRSARRLHGRAHGHRPRRVRVGLRRRRRAGGLDGIAGLPRLVDALRAAGYDDAAIAKITHENWLRVFRATWR